MSTSEPYENWMKHFPAKSHTYSDDDPEMDEIGHEVKIHPAISYKDALSGEVRVINPVTGGMKNRKDCELFTAPPVGMVEYGKVCSYGSRDKYAQNNWRYGFVWSLSANALLRHYLAWVGGEDHDPESGLHHMAHAAWHALVLVQFSVDHPSLDDRFGMPAHPKQGRLF